MKKKLKETMYWLDYVIYEVLLTFYDKYKLGLIIYLLIPPYFSKFVL